VKMALSYEDEFGVRIGAIEYVLTYLQEKTAL
jgi:hypothetical protein